VITAGLYDMHVRVNGDAIAGSPFALSVSPGMFIQRRDGWVWGKICST